MAGALLLEEYRKLFRDEASYEAFVSAFKQATERGMAVVMDDENIIGSVLSRGCTKKVLTDRMVQSIARNPGILGELTDRLNEPIVDRPDAK
jgi:hypothetical protein